jgi:hypothetical protein
MSRTCRHIPESAHPNSSSAASVPMIRQLSDVMESKASQTAMMREPRGMYSPARPSG